MKQLSSARLMSSSGLMEIWDVSVRGVGRVVFEDCCEFSCGKYKKRQQSQVELSICSSHNASSSIITG